MRCVARLGPEGLTGYEAHEERARARNELLSLSGRNISELPAVVNPERRPLAQYVASLVATVVRWHRQGIQVVLAMEVTIRQGRPAEDRG